MAAITATYTAAVMQAMPRRLGRRQVGKLLQLDDLPQSGAMSGARRAIRCARAGARIAVLLGWTLVAIPIQAAMIALPGRGKIRFARLYWATMTRLLGLRVRVLDRGAPAGSGEGGRAPPRRRVIYVSNHSSWLDILVLGGQLEACFVSKAEVASWPVIGMVARLGRTVFVSRGRSAAGREERDMSARLASGDDLILFPEGTSSDGSRVLSFHSTFFALARPRRAGAPDVSLDGGVLDGGAQAAMLPIVQPVSLVYDRLAYLPVGRSARTMFSWFGGMDLARHVWRLAQWRGLRATLLFHPPIDPAAYPTRKALSAATWAAVSGGADRLRQNRCETVPGRAPPHRAARSRPAPAPCPGSGPAPVTAR